MQLLFRPTRAQHTNYSGKRSPFVIWKIKAPWAPVQAALGATWYKCILNRWMLAEGSVQDHNQYGPQFKFNRLQIAGTPYHVALSRALARRMKPFRKSNEDVLFKWLLQFSQSDVLKIWKGDVKFLRGEALNCNDREIQSTLARLALNLEGNQEDDQPARYGEDIKSREWWRFLCWGSLFLLPIGDIIQLFSGPHPQVTSDKIKDNPYVMLPLRKSFSEAQEYTGWADWVDYVARYTKRAPFDSRLDAMVVSLILTTCWQTKSMYCPKKDLFQAFSPGSSFYVEDFNFDEATPAALDASLNRLRESKTVAINRDRVYLYPDFVCEVRSAQLLLDRTVEHFSHRQVEDIVAKAVKKMKDETGIELIERQQEAVALPLKNPVSIVSGLPGTGKTTVGNAIVRAFKAAGKKVKIVTPTGIAAKNAALAMGHPASTIHRGFGWKEGQFSFSRSEDLGTLEADLLIADEWSMVGTSLMHAIVDGISENARVLLIGDPEQLPSIAPGNTYTELLKANLPRVHLKEVHRQAAESGIIRLAHDISNGSVQNLSSYRPEVFHQPASRSQDAWDGVMKCLPEPGADPSTFQIITPTRIGRPLGSEVLNEELARRLNPGNRVRFGFRSFRDGDKVVITKNNYRKSLWNGDIGILSQVSTQGALLHVFGDEQPTEISGQILSDELELAYAITIHKAQGSEFDQVLCVLDPTQTKHVYRNLIYTAITRAKRELTLVCHEDDFRRLAVKEDTSPRLTQLGRWVEQIQLQEPLPEV